MKVVSFILSLVAICSSSFIKSHYSLNQGNGILKQTNIEPYSHNSHPYIPGFSYSYGYVDANRIAIANKKQAIFIMIWTFILRILLLFHVCFL